MEFIFPPSKRMQKATNLTNNKRFIFDASKCSIGFCWYWRRWRWRCYCCWYTDIAFEIAIRVGYTRPELRTCSMWFIHVRSQYWISMYDMRIPDTQMWSRKGAMQKKWHDAWENHRRQRRRRQRRKKNHFKLKSLEFDESLWSMGVSLCVCVLRLLCVACVPMPKISIFMNYFMPSHWKFIHSNDPQEAYTAHKCAITTKWKWRRRRRSRRTKG